MLYELLLVDLSSRSRGAIALLNLISMSRRAWATLVGESEVSGESMV